MNKEELIKQLRKQVRDEIRDAFVGVCREAIMTLADLDSNLYEFTRRDICIILDQIEKGEER